MKHMLVIGIGEVGNAVAEVLSEKYDVSTLDKTPDTISKQVDILHICFPYSNDFVKEVKKYRSKYKPRLTIIYSSVPIGTTKQIPHAVHIPVEGKHPRLNYGVKSFKKFIGSNNDLDGAIAVDIWKPISHYTLLKDSDWTEFLKLASTSKYGINIVWADYMADTAERLDMPYDFVKEWDTAYNGLYRRMKYPQFQKFVLDAPDGYIGGHCITPNAKLLNDAYPDEMLEAIIDMGEPE